MKKILIFLLIIPFFFVFPERINAHELVLSGTQWQGYSSYEEINWVAGHAYTVILSNHPFDSKVAAYFESSNETYFTTYYDIFNVTGTWYPHAFESVPYTADSFSWGDTESYTTVFKEGQTRFEIYIDFGYVDFEVWDEGAIETPTPTPTPMPVLPVINTISNVTLSEGDNYTSQVTLTDPDSSSWTANVDYGDGTVVSDIQLSETNLALNHIYKDNGSYTLVVTITDDQGLSGNGSAVVTVNNVSPEIGNITVNPLGSQAVNTFINAAVNFTDPGALDTHLASWDWGDGNVTGGVVTETSGSGSIIGSHAYTFAGVYTVTSTITDKDGGFGTRPYQYVVVYDPFGGFVSGKGLISLANFGVSAKYRGGDQAPSGNIEYSYCTTFVSTSLDWLVVNGTTAFLRGTGTINGAGNYNILMGATQDSSDKLRVKITDSAGNVVYDNQPGDLETSYPTGAISSGQIKVH